MKLTAKVIIVMIFAGLAGCSSLLLQPADFAWPIEAAMKVDDTGKVSDQRYAFSFNAKQLFFVETGDSTAFASKELRVIRNTKGYYFITSAGFKNVYVFSAAESALKLDNTIPVSQTGLISPAFNQRQPYIELLDGANKYLLDNKGITGK